MSVCSASTWRSNSSFMCSENESGTPAGASGSARASPLRLCASTAWMRRSISRTLSMYLSSRWRSPLPSERRTRSTSPPIQSRMLLRVSRRAARSSGVLPDAEQHVEGDARIADHRQRLARRRPADRVGVGAGVVVGAAAGLIEVLDAELHRRQRRRLPGALGVELIERGAGEQIGALRLLRVRLREEHRARAEVIAADLRQRERLGVARVGVADDASSSRGTPRAC